MYQSRSNQEKYTNLKFYDISQFSCVANLKMLSTYPHIHIVNQIKTIGLDFVIVSDISLDM